MKLATLVTLILFQVFISFTQGNVFTIKRNRHVNVTAKHIYSWDSFTIPASICRRMNIDDECGSFNAESDGGQSCSCFCPSNRTTFIFHDNKWTCLENYKIRNLQGKSYCFPCSLFKIVLPCSATDHKYRKSRCRD